jgi:predicted alpha/beta hydrolase family esterase
MMNAILLHGLPSKEEYYNPERPSASNAHWLPWLQNQLLLKDIKANTPEVFKPYEMKWDAWVEEVERFSIGPETILVGHSMGAGFWVRYLSEHPESQVSQVVLVAPWVNLNHEEDTDFFDFTLRPNITKQARRFSVFASDNDGPEVQNSVEYLRQELKGAKFVDFHNYGHFCYRDLGTDAFPELLDAITAGGGN